MKYKAKDLCSYLNISRETLRYYEQVGFIHPEIDEETRYRSYSDHDIEKIAESRKYRSLDYSIKEIQSLSSVKNFEEYLEILEKKQQYYGNQSDYFQKLAKKNQDSLEILQFSDKLHFTIHVSREIYLDLAYKDMMTFEEEPNKYANFSNMPLDSFAFTDFAIQFTPEDFFLHNSNFTGGTCFTAEWIDLLNIPTDRMEHIPKRKVLTVIIPTTTNFHFDKAISLDITNYMKKNHLTIVGNLLGIQVAKFDEFRLFKFEIPVQ